MPKKFPPEFKRDVVTVARRGDLTIAEVAADFDVSPESVRRWMRQADIDDGNPRRPDHRRAGRGRAAASRQAPLGDGERDPAAGGRVLRQGCAPEMMFPLVRDLAAEGSRCG
jgi:transposase-like protein